MFGLNITFHILYYSCLFELSLNYPYLAVPLFTFMGVVLQYSGIAEDFYNTLYEFLSGFRRGLAVVTIVFSIILTACLGVITSSVTILTLIALGPMVKRGYDKSLASGTIVAAGPLGILVPPSIMLVVYGPQAGISTGKMFMGAIFPGLILSGLYITYITIRCYLNPKLEPPIPEEERHKISSIKKLIKLLKAITPTLLIILAVLGTIYTGIAPPTEAAAVGSFAVVILAIVYRKFTWSLVKHSAIEVLRVSAFVLLIAGLSYAFVGVFMSAGCGEVVTKLIMTFQTPPMEMSIFVCRGTAPPELGVTMNDIIKGVIPFIIIIMICLIICTIFPQIITWLPTKMIGPS